MGSRIVALLTDFGGRDPYVGIMKAVMLARHPDLHLVDLCHEIQAHSVLSGAYILYSAWDYFPPGSAFCAVVDPGVGSARGSLLAEQGGRFLVSPDNGLITLLARMRPELEVYSLNDAAVARLFPPPEGRVPGNTFHGRDLYAPAAALCAAGMPGAARGESLRPLLLSEAMSPRRASGGLDGCILHVDRFGSCITSVGRQDIEQHFGQRVLLVRAGKLILTGLRRTYAEVRHGEALALIGSAGFLELSVREGSAAESFQLGVGDSVSIRPRDSDSPT